MSNLIISAWTEEPEKFSAVLIIKTTVLEYLNAELGFLEQSFNLER